MNTQTNFHISLQLTESQEPDMTNALSLKLTLPANSCDAYDHFDLNLYHADSLYYMGTTMPKPIKIPEDDELPGTDEDDQPNMAQYEMNARLVMEEAERAANRVHLCHDTLTAFVPTRCVWLPGDYFLLVSKKEWVLRIDFSMDEGLIAWPTGQHLCPKDTDDYLLATRLTVDNESWTTLATTPGMAELSRTYLKHEAMGTLRYTRKAAGLGDLRHTLKQVRHHILVADQLPPERILDIFTHKLMDRGVSCFDAATLYNASSNNPYESLDALDYAGSNALCLYNISTLMGTGGKVITAKLENKLRDNEVSALLVATEAELQQLFEVAPKMREFFLGNCRTTMTHATCFEVVQMVFDTARDQELKLAPETEELLVKTLTQAYEQGYISRWTMKDARRYVLEQLATPFLERMLQRQRDGLPATEQAAPTDIDTATLLQPGQDDGEMLRRLNEMVGLASVKQSITTMTHRMRFYAERRRLGLHTTDDAPHHAIFVGSPGTGKTTVARLLGKIYHSLGLLSKGDVVCVDRMRIVGRYIGETEENMKQILSEARGNVLFVDEAYALYSSDESNDYGRHALDTLLPVLAQKNPDMLVIFAGYEKEMDALMSMNPGLLGRFPYKFRFDDYDADELMQIATMQLQRDDYTLSAEAGERLRKVIKETVARRNRHFANARWVEQLVQNGLLPAMASRLAAAQMPLGREAYQRIEVQDVEAAYELFDPQRQQLTRRVSIGFCA